MAKTSFENVDNEIPAVPAAAETPNTPAVQGSSEIVDDTFFENNGMEGFVDKSMVQIPWIHLVHGVGDLSEKFQPGQLVMNGETVLATPMEITFVRSRNFVIQKTTQAEKKAMEVAGEKLAIFKTPEEARRAGFVASWEAKDNPGMPRFENAADMDLLIKGTEDKAELYPLFNEEEGLPYLFARIRCKGNQHRLVTSKLITAVQFNASKKYAPRAFKWQLTTKRAKEGENFVWRMQVQQTGINTPSFIEWAGKLL